MMMDQAQGLRDLVASVREKRGDSAVQSVQKTVQISESQAAVPTAISRPANFPSPVESFVLPRIRTSSHPRVICVASGKGGVGKSSMVLNLAILLSARGKKVLVVDADMGLANIAIMAGIAPQYNLAHHLFGNVPLSSIIIKCPSGVTILPGASGISELADLGTENRQKLMEGLDALMGDYDIVLVDTGAGIGPNVVTFAMASDEVLVVTMAEDIAVADAYGLIKTLFQKNINASVGLIVNRAGSREEAITVIDKVRLVTGHFLGRTLDRSGFVLEDRGLRTYALKQKIIAEQKTFTPYVRCLRKLAEEILVSVDGEMDQGAVKGFFKRLFGILGC
ncbi:MAG: ATP-binding protein [Candidatus Wallbacteria bacterium HGW-Wallbacteria-1]|jgi:flagellar biosynthesis protein FlhG|uniref:ATP-binding protein n=1 Tax=Candidatus Wallbacteria bacterium HGW-Wallbacteria-1 TaxID=2013854 RepID=A0A2N1PSP2_9BACT|nr:MAG: ATP-binding protein [Candidatus Wallbacteria bacterium HGW-Wallbacteria-1]